MPTCFHRLRLLAVLAPCRGRRRRALPQIVHVSAVRAESPSWQRSRYAVNEAKKVLATEATALLHGRAAAEATAKNCRRERLRRARPARACQPSRSAGAQTGRRARRAGGPCEGGARQIQRRSAAPDRGRRAARQRQPPEQRGSRQAYACGPGRQRGASSRSAAAPLCYRRSSRPAREARARRRGALGSRL